MRNFENSYWPTTFAAQWVEQIRDLECVKDINEMKMRLETLQLCCVRAKRKRHGKKTSLHSCFYDIAGVEKEEQVVGQREKEQKDKRRGLMGKIPREGGVKL